MFARRTERAGGGAISVGKAAGIAYLAERVGQAGIVRKTAGAALRTLRHACIRTMIPRGTCKARLCFSRPVAEAPSIAWNASGRIRSGFPAAQWTGSAHAVVFRGPQKKNQCPYRTPRTHCKTRSKGGTRRWSSAGSRCHAGACICQGGRRQASQLDAR